MANEIQPDVMDEEHALNEAPIDTPKQPPAPLPEVTAADIPNEDQVLAHTHQIRKQIVSDLMKSGTPINDSKQMSALLQTLDGMDRQSLTRKRMSADKEIAQGTNDTNTALLAAVLKSIPNIPRPANGEAIPVTRELPSLPDTIDMGEVVDGQTEKAPPQDTYQSFMARNTQAS
jgi:hypothetical protein